MELISIVSFLIALFVIVLFFKLLHKSTKVIVGFSINALVGAVILWVLNIFGLGIAITWLSAAIVGIFGIPGVIVLLVLKFVFKIVL